MVSFYTPVAQLAYHTHSPRIEDTELTMWIGLNLNTVYSPYWERQHLTYLSFCYLLSTLLPKSTCMEAKTHKAFLGPPVCQLGHDSAIC